MKSNVGLINPSKAYGWKIRKLKNVENKKNKGKVILFDLDDLKNKNSKNKGKTIIRDILHDNEIPKITPEKIKKFKLKSFKYFKKRKTARVLKKTVKVSTVKKWESWIGNIDKQ